MTTTHSELTKTPQDREVWEGVGSKPRVLELHGLGVSVTKIADRFGVSRMTIYNTVPELAKRGRTAEPVTTPTTNPGDTVGQSRSTADCITSPATPSQEAI